MITDENSEVEQKRNGDKRKYKKIRRLIKKVHYPHKRSSRKKKMGVGGG